jgi:hypothetical protein
MKPPHQPRHAILRGITVRTGLAALGALLAVSAAGGAGVVNTDPSFSPGPSIPVGPTPSAVAVADFDSDGSSDLAVANSGYKSDLRILLNDGSGRFQAAPGSPIKTSSGLLATADFNRDGKADLAVAGEKIGILLGDGTGRLTAGPGSPVNLNASPGSIAVGDVNRDSSPDLVAAVPQESGGGSKLRILVNDGSGRLALLAEAPPVTGKGYLLTFAVADLNGDGKADLAVADSESDKVSILLGNGTGTFGSATRFRVGKGPGEVVAGDFNEDGRPDLAVPVNYGSALAVLLGNGSGGFGSASHSPMQSDASSLVLSDLNGDGRPDLTTATYDGAAVLLGNGSGGFRAARFSPFHAGSSGVIAISDFNGDGKPDILSLYGGALWWPAQRGNLILFQTSAQPPISAGRPLPARADRVLSIRKPIRIMAVDGNRAAVCTDKGGIVVWKAPVHRSRSLRSTCFDEMAVGGGQVAWIVAYALPNQPELKLVVYAERLSGGHRHIIGRVENEANHDDLRGPWLGQLLGGGSLLAYNDWRVDCRPPPACEDEYCEGCDEQNPTLRVWGQRLVVSGRKGGHARRGPGFYPLRAVGGGRFAVEPAGAVDVLAPNGSRIATVPAVAGDPAREIALSKARLAVTRTSTLDLYSPNSGVKWKSLALGPAAALRLAGVSSKVALLRGLHELVLVRLSDGKLISIPLRTGAAKGLADAKLTGAGLFYAYNLRRGATRGRIVFEPTVHLLARF